MYGKFKAENHMMNYDHSVISTRQTGADSILANFVYSDGFQLTKPDFPAQICCPTNKIRSDGFVCFRAET